jgi:uncharacterized membrane protein
MMSITSIRAGRWQHLAVGICLPACTAGYMIPLISVVHMTMITGSRMASDSGQVTLLLAPNRALDGGQVRRLVWVVCIASLVVAGIAAHDGNVFAPLFTLIEIPVVAVAFWLVWRGGAHKERITLNPDEIRVEQVPPRGRAAITFRTAWVRVWVQKRRDGHQHVVLTASGRALEIGTCLGDDERMQLSQRLKGLLSDRSGWRDS